MKQSRNWRKSYCTNCRYNLNRFKKSTVVAMETFISTTSTYAEAEKDGWTMVGNKGSFMAQHEQTIVVTDGSPLILTEMNEIWSSGNGFHSIYRSGYK